MDNVSIFTASRSAHIKVVVTALVASIAVVIIGFAASRIPVEIATLKSTGIVKARQTLTVTQSDLSDIH
jgi:hypothetical protein